MAKIVSCRHESRKNAPESHASFQALVLVLFLSSSLAVPAPQVLTRVTRVRRPVLQRVKAFPAAATVVHHHDAHPAAVLRAVAPAAVVPFAAAHSSLSSTTVHRQGQGAPAAIRTVSHPVVHTVAHTEPVAHHVGHVQEVRTVPTSSAVSHSHSSITHETPAHTFVRTAVPVAFHGAPVAVHHTPLVHHAPLVHHTPVVDPVVHTVAEPAIVRTVLEEPVAVARVVPRYSYGYSVNDAVSGDSKQRQESRDGDVVTGSYTVADPDGRIRHVEYTADKEHGFRATVTYDGEPGPVAIPFAAPTPIQTTVVATSAPAPQVQVIAARQEVPAFPARTHVVNVADPSQPATTVFRNFFQPAPNTHLVHAPVGGVVSRNGQTPFAANTHLVHAPVGGVASRIVQTPFAAAAPNLVNGFPFGATAIPVRQVFPVDNATDADVTDVA